MHVDAWHDQLKILDPETVVFVVVVVVVCGESRRIFLGLSEAAASSLCCRSVRSGSSLVFVLTLQPAPCVAGP